MAPEISMTEKLLRAYGHVIEFNSGGCWVWKGAITEQGYGNSALSQSGTRFAHRMVYVALRGPVPDDLGLDHLCHGFPCPGGPTCRHRRCVNPEHLKPATAAENSRRGAKTYMLPDECRRGHLFSPENTYISAGKRICKTCRRMRDRAYEEVPGDLGLDAYRYCRTCRAGAGESCVERSSVHGPLRPIARVHAGRKHQRQIPKAR